MNNKKTTKRALLSSVMAIVLCLAMLIGTTFAWFTDTASTAVNKIQAGTLDVALEMATSWSGDTPIDWGTAEGQTLRWMTADGRGDDMILWEPGCTYNLNQFRIVNNGNLALKYKISISGIVGDAELLDAIDFTVTGVDGATTAAALNGFEGKLAANSKTGAITISGHMQDSAGNEYQGKSIDGIAITVVATQDNVEADSFGTDYDATAVYPAAPSIVKAVASGKVTNADANTTVTDTASAVQATIPANTLEADDNVVLTVERKAMTADSVTYDIDFKVNERTPTLSNPVSVNINIGAGLKDVVATHNGHAMTKVDNAVNDQEYSYNRETGILTIVTKTFSPFAIEYKTDFTAKIGNIGYATIADAFEAAKTGDTIVLINNTTTAGQLVVAEGKTVTLDLAGYTINSTYTRYSIANYGTLTINDSGTTGAIYNSSKVYDDNYGHDAVRNFGMLTINGGRFGDATADMTDANDCNYGAAVRNQVGATCVINGGAFSCLDNYGVWQNSTAKTYSYAIRNFGEMTINGGTVYGAMNGGIAADGGQITIKGGNFSVTGSTSWWVLTANTSTNAKIIVNGGTFTKDGGANNTAIFGGFSGMPSWDAMDDLAGNGFTVTGGTFTLNGKTVVLKK